MKDRTVCIIGLGYVGLPLVKAFSKHLKVIGYDVDAEKIRNLGNNNNNEENIEFTADPSMIKQADFVIIAVPTPVTKSKEPDLSFVTSATEIVGKNLKKGAIVVLESTVYPGVTEEVVKPILEKESKMDCGIDFKIGYSPERINPGDEAHTLAKITKIVAGMDKLFCKQKPLLKNAYASFLQAKRFTKKYDETSNAAKNMPARPTKREKISVNPCLKKYYSCFMTTMMRGMLDREERKGFYYKRL